MSEEDMQVLRGNAAMVTSQVREILSGERRAGDLTLNPLASIAAAVPALLDRIAELESQLQAIRPTSAAPSSARSTR